jgi:hypothetical protein
MSPTAGVGRLRDPRDIEAIETKETPPARNASVPARDPELDRFYGSLSPIAASSPTERAADVQARLDGVRDAFSGPYRAEGQVVTARPMFRINAGFNTKQMESHAKELDALARRVGANGPAARYGYGSPANLVKVTQALIDAGALPPGPPGKLADRIRAMQWEWGVGVDCAAYTRYALEAATQKSGASMGLQPPGFENFTGLAHNSGFARVSVTDVRPGDVMTLTNPIDYGHNVIVHGRVVVDDERKAVLLEWLPPAARPMLESAGPHHMIEVDSSWGAGESGAAWGGYRRDTWLYDESAKQWGYVNPHTSPPSFEVSPLGPAGDRFSGAFRARG